MRHSLVWSVLGIASIILTIASSSCCLALAPNIQFRAGSKSDELSIALMLGRELMNPLGISADRFLIAQDVSNNKNNMIGFVQIKPLGTKKQNPNQYNARLGSYDAEREVDDDIWEKFEKDETPFPIGWASLPWTKEYRQFSDAARARREKREQMLENERRSEELLWELSSVYVLPNYRGKGIGTELVRRALRKHEEMGRRLSDLYLLTLKTTSEWYKDKFGFELVPDYEVPQQMIFEITAGKVITSLIGAQLCCMRGKKSKSL